MNEIDNRLAWEEQPTRDGHQWGLILVVHEVANNPRVWPLHNLLVPSGVSFTVVRRITRREILGRKLLPQPHLSDTRRRVATILRRGIHFLKQLVWFCE